MRQKKILSSTCQLISNLNTFLDVKESIHLLKEKLENKYIQQGEMCQQLMTIWDQLSGLKLYSFFDYDKNNRDVFSQFEKRLSELSPALPLKKIKDAFEDELKVSFEKAKAQLNRCSDEEKKVLSRELLDAVNLKSLEKRVNERLQKYKRNVLRLLTVSDLKTPKDRQADPMFPDVAYLAELKQNFSLIDREMPAIAPSLRQLLEFITVEDKSIVLSESARYFAFSEHEDKIGHQKQLLKDEGMQILLDELQPLIDLSEKNKLVRAKHFRIQGNEDAIQKEVFLTLLIFGHYIKIDSFLSELASKSRSFGFEEETSRFFKDAQDRYAVLFQSNVKKLLFWSIYQDKQQSIVEKKECVARVKFEKETIKEAQRQLKDIVVQYEEAEFLCSFQKRHAFNNACSLYAKHMKDLQGKIVSYSEKMESNKTDPFLLHLSKFTFLLNKMKPDYEDQIQSKKIVFNRETIQKLERRYKITQDRLSDLPDSELQGLCQFFNELTYDTLSRHRQIGSESKHEHVAFLKSLKSNETRYPFYFDTIELDYLILLLSLRVSVGDCRANKKKLNIQSINDFFENNHFSFNFKTDSLETLNAYSFLNKGALTNQKRVKLRDFPNAYIDLLDPIGNALKSIFSASIIFLKDKPYSNKALLINVVLKWFLNKEYKINIKDEQSKSLLECNSILANEIVKEIYLKKDVPFKRSQKETLVTTEGHFILDALKTGFDSLEVDLNGLIDARKSNVNVLKRFPFFLKVLMCVKLGAVSNYFVDEFLKESLKEATFNIGRVIVGMKPLLLSRIRFLDEMEAIMVTQEMPMDTLEDYDSLAWDLSVFHYKTQLITKEKDSCGNEFRQPFICHDSHVSEKKEKIKTRGLSNQNGPSVDALTVKNSPKPMLSDATHGLINAMTLTTQRRDDFVAGLVTSMVAIKHHVEPRFLLSMEEDIANTILNAKSFKSLDDRGQLRVVFLLDLIRNQALSLETFFSKSKARVFFEYTLDKTLKEDRSIQLTLKGKFIPNENASGVIKLYIDDYAPNNYSVQRLSLMVKGTQISSFQIHKKVHN